jgi:hypothetical protein
MPGSGRNKSLVLRSINDETGSRCVDIFQRAQGDIGFEEYRRDIEDGRGWFAIGGHGTRSFATQDAALQEALKAVTWLRDVIGSKPPSKSLS